MAEIYLVKRGAEPDPRRFHLGARPLAEIVELFGVISHDAPMADEPLSVVIAIQQEEAAGTEFEAGELRATIDPLRAMRHCGVGLASILGSRAS